MKLIKFIATILFLTGCSVYPEILPIIQTDNIKEIIPEGWPAPHYNFSNNPLTPDGFVLGKTLFYDPILSSDNSRYFICARTLTMISSREKGFVIKSMAPALKASMIRSFSL